MQVILCSTYLERQQERAERAAAAALRRPIARPEGLWGQVGWWLSGRELAVRLVRFGEARDREGDALRYAQGRGGEELLVRVLARHLDDGYTLLRNYTPPDGRRGDIDAVLLGPHGVTTFEVKAWRGCYRVSGDAWFLRESPRDGWRPSDKNPSLQALDNAKRLRAVLARQDLGAVPVRPVVAIASNRTYVEIEPPLTVALFFATQPQRDLAADLGPLVLDEEQVHAVLSALLRDHP
jgi:hypothetical protein